MPVSLTGLLFKKTKRKPQGEAIKNIKALMVKIMRAFLFTSFFIFDIMA